jgi:hypothetical protein
MTLNLAVENYDNIVGTGEDDPGKFTVNGKIVPTRINFVKTYTTHTVEYTGTSDDEGVNYAGDWLIAETDVIAETWGTFTMKPPDPCVTAIKDQDNYQPPTVRFTYEADLPNGFGSFSPDTYQETVCGASSSTSCDSVANTFTYQVVATYTLADASTMTDQECANAIAAANGVLPSAVTCSLTATRRLTADGRRLNDRTATADIVTTYPERAQAVAASVKDTTALQSALGTSASAPALEGTPTMKVKAETKVAVPDGSTDAVKGEFDANLANRLSGAIPGTKASMIPVATEAGADAVTCGEIKQAFKRNNCCGNPNAAFVMSSSRRLKLNAADEQEDLLTDVKNVLASLRDSGDSAKEDWLKKEIRMMIKN